MRALPDGRMWGTARLEAASGPPPPRAALRRGHALPPPATAEGCRPPPDAACAASGPRAMLPPTELGKGDDWRVINRSCVMN